MNKFLTLSMLSLTKMSKDSISSVNSCPLTLAVFAFSPVTAVMEVVLLPKDFTPTIQKSRRSPVANICVPQQGSLQKGLTTTFFKMDII